VFEETSASIWTSARPNPILYEEVEAQRLRIIMHGNLGWELPAAIQLACAVRHRFRFIFESNLQRLLGMVSWACEAALLTSIARRFRLVALNPSLFTCSASPRTPKIYHTVVLPRQVSMARHEYAYLKACYFVVPGAEMVGARKTVA